MKRPAHQEKTAERIRRWREICPDLTIRSTFIVGFPGETEEEFEFLLDWLDEVGLDRVGCFKYEPVAGATSNDLAGHVPPEVMDRRWNRFMKKQAEVSARRIKRKVGTRQQVIVDEVGPTVVKARSKGDAPEIDGSVFIHTKRRLAVGDLLTVKIDRASEYDLFASL